MLIFPAAPKAMLSRPYVKNAVRSQQNVIKKPESETVNRRSGWGPRRWNGIASVAQGSIQTRVPPFHATGVVTYAAASKSSITTLHGVRDKRSTPFILEVVPDAGADLTKSDPFPALIEISVAFKKLRGFVQQLFKMEIPVKQLHEMQSQMEWSICPTA
jgi:hypothetical protein